MRHQPKNNFFVRTLLACLAVGALFFSPDVFAQEAAQGKEKHPRDEWAGLDRMNGYSLKDYPGFIKTWRFVTVRYRKDTGELRITYANEQAYKTLKDGKIDYPDGAIFAKVGLMTQEDPGFISSMVPSGAQRYQLMVMDKEKNKTTDGWGYALFDQDGKTFGDNPVERAQACHACHKLVPERGYVFSQPISLSVGKEKTFSLNFFSGNKNETDVGVMNTRLLFETSPVLDLPEKLVKKLPTGIKEIRRLRGPLEKSLFYGTLDEIRPSLAREAIKTKKPAVLVDTEGKLFSAVFVSPDKKECTLDGGKKGVPMKAYFTDIVRDGRKIQELFVRELFYCESME